MRRNGIVLALLLTVGSSVIPLPRPQADARLELYGTFHALGVTLSLSSPDDPNGNAVATVEYRQGSAPYRAGFPLSRVSPTQFVGSLFWLEPGTPYDVRVTVRDSDGDPLDGVVVQATTSTREEITIPPANNSWVVAPTGRGTICDPAAPCALVEGISRAQPGDEVVLRAGVYYQGEIKLPRSGRADAPIVIRSYEGEAAVLDGAQPTTLTWTAGDGGVYQTIAPVADANLVIANGVRLYPYHDLVSLQNLSWALPGFYADGSLLYLHLAKDADPNNAAVAISRYNRGFDVEQDYIYFVNLTLRHYGHGAEARAIYFENASNNLVQNSVFAVNNGGISIKDASHRNVIQDNEFYDTIFSWPWDSVKATGLLERGGVYASGAVSSRGNVIRRNIFHDFFDGFDVCPSEPLSDEPTNETNETDVYDNLVYNIGDDGVQVDGWCSNVRLWNNTFHDVLVGVSFAPTVGGPVYAMRNLIYNFGAGNNNHGGRSFKFNSSSAEVSGPIFLIHNTADVAALDAPGLQISSGQSNGWALIYARNNIWSSTTYALRNNDIQYPVDFDYNNLWSGDYTVLVRWDTTHYTTVNAFNAATGQELHGHNLNPDFVRPLDGNYALNPTSPLIDAGVIIPGINDNYLGAGPDIGAVETAAVARQQLHLPVVVGP